MSLIGAVAVNKTLKPVASLTQRNASHRTVANKNIWPAGEVNYNILWPGMRNKFNFIASERNGRRCTKRVQTKC